jgi:hypothetical protein
MRVHGSLEEEWQSYFEEVLEKHGVGAAAAPGLRNLFFAGAGSALSLLQHVPATKLRDEIVAFHASLPGRSN